MESSELDIKRYLQLIHKKKHIFIITAITIITVAVIGGYFLPKVYEAKSTVFIEKNVISNLIKDIAITPSMEERLRVLSYAMKSRNLLLKVIDDLAPDVNREDSAEVEKLVERFQENTDINIGSRSRGREMDMFIVSYRDEDPKLARDYVNTLVRRYVEENLSAKREEAYEANRFLAEQIRFFKKKLDTAEEEITSFRRDKGIFIAVDERSIVGEIKNAQEEIEELKLQKMALEAKKSLIKKQIEDESPYTVAIFGRRTGDSLDNRLIMLHNRLNELMVKYTENYPEVIRVMAEIESLNEQLKNEQTVNGDSEGAGTEMSTLNPLYQQLREELSSIGLELAALDAKEEHYKKLIASKKTYLRTIPVEKKNLADLERERDTSNNIYEDLVVRLGQSEVSKQMELQDKATTFRIVDPAVLPVKPVSPDRVKIILLGILAGLAGGFGIVFMLDNMDKSVRTVNALKTLEIPLLAIIPSIRNPEELIKRKRKDILIYSLTGLYMLCILGVFAIEFMGLTYIDDFVQQYLR